MFVSLRGVFQNLAGRSVSLKTMVFCAKLTNSARIGMAPLSPLRRLSGTSMMPSWIQTSVCCLCCSFVASLFDHPVLGETFIDSAFPVDHIFHVPLRPTPD